MVARPSLIYREIEAVVEELKPETITKERRDILQPLVEYIQNKVNNNQKLLINFICTHNSRRSHFSQVWAQTLAYYFNIQNVFCYSGGTEVTALFPMVSETLINSGFKVDILSNGNNPVYSIKYAKNEHPIIGFSKKMNDKFNPTSEFAAVMTCSQADEGCPFITGAEKRISIPFEDPKVYDNTPAQAKKYQQRSLQIATELFYIFSQINLKK